MNRLHAWRMPLAFLALLTATFFVGTVVQTQDTAYALVKPPLPVSLPGTLAGAGVVAAEAEVATVAAAAGGAATTVAVAPVAVAAAAVLAVGGLVYLGIRWKTGHQATYADSPSGGPRTFGGGWNALYTGTGSNQRTLAGVYGTIPDPQGVQRSPTSVQWLATYGNSNGSGGAFGQCLNSCSLSTVGNTFAASIDPTRNFYPLQGVWIIGNAFNNGSVGPSRVVAKYGQPDLQQLCNYAGTTTCGTAATLSETTASYPAGQRPLTTVPTSQCSNGATVSGTPVSYTGSTTTLPALVLPACPAGTTRTGASFPTTDPGGVTAPSPLAPWTAPTIPTGFPECQSAGSCQLVLQRVGVGTAAQTQTCNGSGACVGWQTETTKTGPKRQVKTLTDGSLIAEPSRVYTNGDHLECKWGPYEISVDECATVPTEIPNQQDGPADEEGADGECFPHGWSVFNPVEWVYKPVKCALVWAFVPDPTVVQADFAQVQADWSGTVLGTALAIGGDVLGPFASLATFPSDDAGCEGPHVVFDLHSSILDGGSRHNDWTPFNMCSTVGEYVHDWAIPLVSAILYLVTVERCAGMLLGAFGLKLPTRNEGGEEAAAEMGV